MLKEYSLDIAYNPRVNFAFHQNAIPVINRLILTNNSAYELKNIKIMFNFFPLWANTFEKNIEFIPSNKNYILDAIPVTLNMDYLAKLSERVSGKFEIEIYAETSIHPENQLILKNEYPIDIFSFNEWTGHEILPEILAAFVTPNLYVINDILSRASDLLKQNTGSSSLNGYQLKNKKKVYEILNSIFNAVKELKIRYCNPPASFEKTGQKIRFADIIKKNTLATCMDLSLLFASIIEQSGLRPLILQK